MSLCAAIYSLGRFALGLGGLGRRAPRTLPCANLSHSVYSALVRSSAARIVHLFLGQALCRFQSPPAPQAPDGDS